MRYQLIGIDLDGTLLDDRSRVSDANVRAIAAAREAGAIVVPCTGRAWREAYRLLQDVEGLNLGVFVTGAMVADMTTGSSVDFACIEPHLALELVEHLRHEPEAVLVYREPQLVGYDYLVTGDGELTPATQQWFQDTRTDAHFQHRVTADDLHHVLRVGMVASADRLPALSQHLAERFDGQIQLHHFPVGNPEHGVHALEVFASGVDKWRGLTWLADTHDIPRDRIAAIGDQVNDLSMVRHAACGIAMANGVEPLRDIADRITDANTDDGVAKALHRLIDGAW